MFGLAEISIGLVTLFATALSFILGKSAKSPEVLIFVIIASAISLVLGIGLLRLNARCYRLLLFFAAVIIISKVLIFAKIITLSGALETSISSNIKNLVSVVYHIVLIWYFRRPNVVKQFLTS